MKAIEPIIVRESDLAFEQWNDPTRGSIRWKTLLSSERTNSKGVTCGVAEVSPGASEEGLKPHKHLPAEVYYILRGKGVVTIDDVAYDVSEGTVVFIPSNAIHGIENSGSDVLKFFYSFGVDSFEEVEYLFV